MAVRVFSLLPARPLHGRPPGLLGAVALGIVVFGLFGGGLVFLLGFVAPGLVTDAQVRTTARVLRDGAVASSDCSGADLIEICDLTLSAPVGEEVVTRGVHYVFGSDESRIDSVQVVADPARPGWMTTDMALDRFWNRVASLALGAVALGGLVAGGVWAVGRIVWRRRAWARAGALPVPLRLVSRQRVHRGQMWVVGGDDGQTERWPVPRRAEPFLLGAGDRILGLQRIGGTAIMPLDAKLRWVDLSRGERAAVLARAAASG